MKNKDLSDRVICFFELYLDFVGFGALVLNTGGFFFVFGSFQLVPWLSPLNVLKNLYLKKTMNSLT